MATFFPAAPWYQRDRSAHAAMGLSASILLRRAPCVLRRPRSRRSGRSLCSVLPCPSAKRSTESCGPRRRHRLRSRVGDKAECAVSPVGGLRVVGRAASPIRFRLERSSAGGFDLALLVPKVLIACAVLRSLGRRVAPPLALTTRSRIGGYISFTFGMKRYPISWFHTLWSSRRSRGTSRW